METIKWNGDYKELPPVEYKITERIHQRRWWQLRAKRDYWLSCEFSELGPFATPREAMNMFYSVQHGGKLVM